MQKYVDTNGTNVVLLDVNYRRANCVQFNNNYAIEFYYTFPRSSSPLRHALNR